ncbi:MAG: hypothetical protein JXA03_00790 [Bacteroidales bacterium]|nr:hypothetical protein [Bacteroidales bacterium]
MNLKKSVFTLFALAALFFACKHSPEEIQPPPGGNPVTPPIDTLACDSTNVSYPGTVVPILNAYCISCHSGSQPSGGLDFNDYSDLAFVAKNGSLIGSMKHLSGFSPMPKDGNKLSECEIALVEKWINDTVFNVIIDTTECDSSAVTYPGTVFPILQANCISCHSGPAPEAGMDFNDYEQVATIAQTGALMGSIMHLTGYSPMPDNAPKLSACEIALIRKWINDTTFIPGGGGGIPCDPDTAYFQNDVLPLLQSSCGVIGCHDPGTATERVILTSYNFVMQTTEVVPGQPWESEIYEVIMEDDPEKRMPPSPQQPLTVEQKALIYKWIAQGALNNHCDDEDCDSINVTFSQTVWPIVQNSCFGCHSGPAPSGGISLTNHGQVKAASSIPAGNPGSLLGSVTWANGNVPMPKNGFQLSECKIAQIKKWIQDGMPNN